MNNLKTSPTGIDAVIHLYQQYLYNALKEAWRVSDDQVDLYGRAYRLQESDGYTPNVYMGSKEYKEVFFDDTKAATGFFITDENIKYSGGTATCNAALIISCNMKSLHPTLDMGADEVIHNEVQKICFPLRFGMEMSGFVTGIDNVFKEFSGWRKKDGIKNRDMYPLHCFRINFNLLYNILN
jgi:hypothetical protein